MITPEENELLKTNIYDLELTTRIQNAFEFNNIRTLGGIVKYKKQELLRMERLGPSSVEYIEKLVKSLGFELGNPYKLTEEERKSSDTSTLKSLGSGKTTYAKKPSQKILETFQNQHKGIYLVPFTMERDEFSSLCPKTGQPDQARMEFIYVPNDKMVESKSLKLYYFSFRNTGEFHEDVTNRIAKDLYAMLQPKYLRVYADFAPRGGIAIRPIVELWGTKTTAAEAAQIKDLVTTWDIKK